MRIVASQFSRISPAKRHIFSHKPALKCLAWRLLIQESEVGNDSLDGYGNSITDDGDCGGDWRTGDRSSLADDSLQSQAKPRNRERTSEPSCRFSPATP